jgi:hypothetical protein
MRQCQPCDWGFASLLLSCEVSCGCGGGAVTPTPPEGGATSRPLGQVKHRSVGECNTCVRWACRMPLHPSRGAVCGVCNSLVTDVRQPSKGHPSHAPATRHRGGLRGVSPLGQSDGCQRATRASREERDRHPQAWAGLWSHRVAGSPESWSAGGQGLLVAGKSRGVVCVVWWLPQRPASCPSSSRTSHADHASRRVRLARHRVRHRVGGQPSCGAVCRGVPPHCKSGGRSVTDSRRMSRGARQSDSEGGGLASAAVKPPQVTHPVFTYKLRQ